MEPGIFHVDHKRAEKKVIVRYMECLRNHAAEIGGHATDGCCEFMASGEDSILGALRCSACICHRNFHRKSEIESDQYCNNSPSSLFTLFTTNSTHSFVEASKDKEPGIFHVDHKRGEKKIIVRYMECLRNHAAEIGGHATDGCCEFMASGEDSITGALRCSACTCHRNFHRKLEIESDQYCNNSPSSQHYALPLIAHHKAPILAHLSPNKSGSTSHSDQSDGKNGEDHGIIKGLKNPTEKVMKKRSRTKFTQEQKEN